MALAQTTYVYISNGGDDGAGGIYCYRLDTTAVALEFQAATPTPSNTKFIAIDPQQRYLYATSTTNPGDTNGLIHAFAIDAQTGGLTLLNQVDVKGSEPAHCSLDRAGKFAFVANYFGAGGIGTLTVFPLETNGRIGEMSDYHEITGSSVHPDRQQRSHPHQILIDPSNRFVLVPDLGTDKIMVYAFDASEGKLSLHGDPIAVPPGSGPRHVAFHPTLPYVYLITELENTLIAYHMDAEGTFHQIQLLSTLPDNFKGESYCAAVRLSPDGKFVYGSNRGHNSIVIFAVSPDTGALTLVGHEWTRGNWPRDFNIDPSGKVFIASNQNSNDLFLYKVDASAGTLQPIDGKIEMPEPICIEFAVFSIDAV